MVQLWGAFTPEQRRSIGIYILGIMCYKFALEYFNGAFITMANERFGNQRYEKIAILTGVNYAMQGVGSILIAPLIKVFPTRTVLSSAVFVFGLISAIVLIVDASTGGQLKFKTADNKTHYGNWNPNALFPIYTISGISYGMVELIRRVIPRDLVGGDVQRLRKMDSIVHVMYEVAGTAGAFTSTSLIGLMGYNYSSFLSPILFSFAGLIWAFLPPVGSYKKLQESSRDSTNLAAIDRGDRKIHYTRSVLNGLHAFTKAFWYGGYLVLTNRKFAWLPFSYTIALYLHRALENQLAPIFARSVIGTSAYSQIIVGGSNFGELLGALSVMLFTNVVHTPAPWLRLDALALNLVWVMPFISVVRQNVSSAWRLAGIFIPISYGWAAGDVSLAAYIQSSLAKMESEDRDVSSLGAVMAFLYTTYIIIYALISTFLGRWVDRYIRGYTGAAQVQRARDALKYVGGTQFSVGCVIILASTFIPRGSFALNPKSLDGNAITDEEQDSVANQTADDASFEKKGQEADDEKYYEQPRHDRPENDPVGIQALSGATRAAKVNI